MYRITIFFHTPSIIKHITLWSHYPICPSSRLSSYITVTLKPLVKNCSKVTYYVTYISSYNSPATRYMDNYRSMHLTTEQMSSFSKSITNIKNNFKNG